MIVKPANAQTLLTLPTPVFTVNFVGESYNFSIDPYTGMNLTGPNNFVTNGTIIMTITNSVGFFHDLGVFYNVRMKGHYESDNWTNDIYTPPNSPGGFQAYSACNYTIQNFPAESYPPDSKIDFQVQSVVYNVTHVPYNPNSPNTETFENFTVYAISNWSGTQTVTIFSSSASILPTMNPLSTVTVTTAIPELTGLITVPLLLSILSVAVMLRHRKAHNTL
jgi:hypothetical protein